MKKVFCLASVLVALIISLIQISEQQHLPKQIASAAHTLPVRTNNHESTRAEAESVHIVSTLKGFTIAGLPNDRPAGPGWKSPAKPVVPQFPKSFADPVQVRSGIADVSARPVGGRESIGSIAEDGSLIYKEAFKGCDVQYRCTALKTEEFIIVHDEHSQTTWSWDLDLGKGKSVLTPRITQQHSIELMDDSGVPRLRINAPDGKDADGNLLIAGQHLKYSIEGNRLSLTLIQNHLRYPVIIDPTWASTGTMAFARLGHASALLGSGKVLVVGGDGPSSYLAACEIFDPISETWTATGSMIAGRDEFVLTMLTDGRILVCGGRNNSGLNGSEAEIYDPTSGNWTATTPMSVGRVSPGAALLPSGKVLVCGGFGLNSSTGQLSGTLASCEIYDAQTSTWVAAQNMANARALFPVTVLGDGSALVTGGDVAGSIIASCEVYSPQNNVWSTINPMSTPRCEHASFLLNNGSTMVIGSASFSPSASCEILSSGQWVAAGSLHTARSEFGSSFLAGGRILVSGGGGGTNSQALGSVEFYDPTTDSWTVADSIPIASAQNSQTRMNNQKILLTGGWTGTVVLANCFIFDPHPFANPQNIAVHTGKPVSIALSSTALTSTVSYTIIATTSNGNLSGIPPNLMYTSQSSFVGTETFTFKANDGYLDSVPATVTINVSDTAPIAASQSATTHLNQPINLTLVASDSENDPLTFTLTQPAHGSLSGTAPNVIYMPNNAYIGSDSFTFKTNDGALDSNVATVTINVTDAAPVATSQSVSTHFNQPINLTLAATDADSDPLTFTLTLPTHGSLSGTAPNVTYTPNNAYVGSDSFTFKTNDGAVDSNIATVSINVTNHSPTVTGSGSPTVLLEGQSVSFTSTASDPDGDPITYLWNFNDGSTSALVNPVHTYSTAGIYNATVTVTDGAGASATATVVINVYKNTDRPTARFTTSDVVAFVGAPFTLDASFSTDPLHAITNYTWDFGDGSATGSGQVISTIYAQTGAVSVTLTITDSRGLTDTMTRLIEVLPLNQIGLFNASIDYSTKFDLVHANTDTFTMTAVINTGDATIAAGTHVGLTVAGQTFSGTLDTKLRDFTNVNTKWQVSANLRGKPFGEVIVKTTIKKASLGAGYVLLGAVPTDNLHDIITIDVPVHIEVADRTIDVVISTDFKFSSATKANGSGKGP